MNRAREVFWWALFIPLSLWVQSVVPGVDALAAGVILLALEERTKALCWFVPFCILIQEGIGTQAFGSSFLWYASILILLAVLRMFVECREFLFVCLLACAMGPVYILLCYLVGGLQNVMPDTHVLLGRGLAQALFTPPAWALAARTHRWVYTDA